MVLSIDENTQCTVTCLIREGTQELIDLYCQM